MAKYYCTACDMGFCSLIDSTCPRCRQPADDFKKHRQAGFVGVETLQEAVAILGKQLIGWRYAHRPVLEDDFGKCVDSFHVYFVNDDGDEVAAWSLRLSCLQLFRPPRKVDRACFPDGPRKIFKGHITGVYL